MTEFSLRIPLPSSEDEWASVVLDAYGADYKPSEVYDDMLSAAGYAKGGAWPKGYGCLVLSSRSLSVLARPLTHLLAQFRLYEVSGVSLRFNARAEEMVLVDVDTGAPTTLLDPVFRGSNAMVLYGGQALCSDEACRCTNMAIATVGSEVSAASAGYDERYDAHVIQWVYTGARRCEMELTFKVSLRKHTVTAAVMGE